MIFNKRCGSARTYPAIMLFIGVVAVLAACGGGSPGVTASTSAILTSTAETSGNAPPASTPALDSTKPKAVADVDARYPCNSFIFNESVPEYFEKQTYTAEQMAEFRKVVASTCPPILRHSTLPHPRFDRRQQRPVWRRLPVRLSWPQNQ